MICIDHQKNLAPAGPQARSGDPVSGDVERLLGPKSIKELNVLESQISSKLRSNEPIDVEYWEQLLLNIAVYKAKAELNRVYKSIIESRLNDLRQEQLTEADGAKAKLALLLTGPSTSSIHLPESSVVVDNTTSAFPPIHYSRRIDPEPHLRLRAEDKTHDMAEEADFLSKVVSTQDLWSERWRC